MCTFGKNFCHHHCDQEKNACWSDENDCYNDVSVPNSASSLPELEREQTRESRITASPATGQETLRTRARKLCILCSPPSLPCVFAQDDVDVSLIAICSDPQHSVSVNKKNEDCVRRNFLDAGEFFAAHTVSAEREKENTVFQFITFCSCRRI